MAHLRNRIEVEAVSMVVEMPEVPLKVVGKARSTRPAQEIIRIEEPEAKRTGLASLWDRIRIPRLAERNASDH